MYADPKHCFIGQHRAITGCRQQILHKKKTILFKNTNFICIQNIKDESVPGTFGYFPVW